MKSLKISAKEKAIEQIKAYLLDGRISVGEKLLAERDLAEEIGVSRTALRAAITELTSAGVLLSVHGSGNYVRPKKISQILQAADSFSRMVWAEGMTPSSKLRYVDRFAAGEKIAEKLGLDPTDELFVLSRLRLANKQAISIETAYIPMKHAQGIERYDFEKNSLYDVLERDFGLIAKHGSEEITLSLASAEEAKDLGVEEGTPVLFERATEFNDEGLAIEYVETVLLNERYRFLSIPNHKHISRLSKRWMEF